MLGGSLSDNPPATDDIIEIILSRINDTVFISITAEFENCDVSHFSVFPFLKKINSNVFESFHFRWLKIKGIIPYLDKAIF